MEAKLQEEIGRLPVVCKAHIYEPTIEDVARISFLAGVEQGRREAVKLALDSFYLCPPEIAEQNNCDVCLAFYTKLKEWGIE